MKNKKLLQCVAFCASPFAYQNALAADIDSYPQLDEVVVVASKIATPYAQVAATVTTVERDEIEQVAAASLRDVLRYMPGVNLRRDPARFGYDSISIRGIGGNRVAVLIDGAPTAKGFAIGNYSDSGRALPDLDSVQHIEILRGPASALYGSDAIGGVVSITTLAPSDLLRDEAFGGQLRAGYRDDVEELRAGIDLAARFGPISALVGYTHRDAGDIDTTGSLEPNPRDARGDSVDLKLVWDEAPGGAMRLSGGAQRVHVQTDVNSLVLAPGRFANTTALSGDDHSDLYRAMIDQSLTGGAISGDWRVYWQQTEVQQDSQEDRRAAPPRAPDPLHFDRRFTMQTDVLGGELTLSHRVDGERVQQRWVYGLAASYSEVTEQRDGRQINRTTGVVSNDVLGEIMPVRDFPISTLLEAGAYVQNDIRIDERWSLIPGIRIDYYDLSPKPDAVYLADNSRTTAVSVLQRSVSPKLGVVYQWSDAISSFAQYAHGFRAQPMEDVNIGLDIPTQNIRAIPNPDLQPETSDSVELGMRVEHETARASLSAYYTEYDDFIESKRNIGPDPAQPTVTLFQSQNIARAHIYGLEVDAVWQLGDIGTLLRGWSLAFSATWSEGEDDVRNVSLNAVNPAEALVKVTYRASRAWSADVIFRVVDAKDDVVTPPTATVPLAEVSSYTTLDAFLHWQLTEKLKLDIGVTNALDRDYQVWSDVRERPSNDPQLPLYYQPGRAFVAALKWLF